MQWVGIGTFRYKVSPTGLHVRLQRTIKQML